MSQSSKFLQGEGDGWYARNQEVIESQSKFEDVHETYRILAHHKESINQILEIGCSSGLKLQTLCELFEASGFGVDPSEEAIRRGNQRLQELRVDIDLQVGVASKLPFGNQQFDMISLGFFLYLEDREHLFESLARADNSLKPGGFLTIRDFAPEFPQKTQYHHQEGIYSYKNNYRDFFLSLGHYDLVASIPFGEGGVIHFEKQPSRRQSLDILHKRPDPYPLCDSIRFG